jgi:hypothetical protein
MGNDEATVGNVNHRRQAADGDEDNYEEQPAAPASHLDNYRAALGSWEARVRADLR